MFKKFALLSVLAVFAQSAYAAKGSIDLTSEFDLPASMKGCSILRLKNDDFNAIVLYVTHCPNAKTDTTLPGKNPVHVISNSIIDTESLAETNPSDINATAVIEVNGERYAPFEAVSKYDTSKTIEINGKKYVKLK